jgi:hypothetical protein
MRHDISIDPIIRDRLDFEIYRARANFLRRRAMRHAVMLRLACWGMLATSTALALTLLVVPATMRALVGDAVVAQTSFTSIW